MLQLNQLGNADDEANMPELYYWAQLFRATTWEEIIMLAEKNNAIREGIVTLKELSEDEKIQLECEARERYRRDLASATSYGEKQGRELGRTEERAVSISILVTTLKELNHTQEQIIDQLVKKYNLSPDEAKEHMKDDI